MKARRRNNRGQLAVIAVRLLMRLESGCIGLAAHRLRAETGADRSSRDRRRLARHRNETPRYRLYRKPSTRVAHTEYSTQNSIKTGDRIQSGDLANSF